MYLCPKCEGGKTIKCPTCGGKDNKYFVPVLDFWESDCTECYGLGTVKCPDCDGRAHVLQAPPHSPIRTAKENHTHL